MTEATWGLVGATFLLAIITSLMLWLNHRIIVRMDIQREESIRPVLTLQLIPMQARNVKLRIQNLGSGPALDVEVNIWGENFVESGSAFDWSYPVLGPGGTKNSGRSRHPYLGQ